MNQAIRIFKPTTNRISVALLTVFIAFFALFAQSHIEQDVTASQIIDNTNLTTFCDNNVNSNRSKVLIRYH